VDAVRDGSKLLKRNVNSPNATIRLPGAATFPGSDLFFQYKIDVFYRIPADFVNP